jgi:mRNA interferase RelE/StbE
MTGAARRGLNGLPKRELKRIVERIAYLADDPRPTGVKKLRGEEGLYRVREGDYRIAFRIEDERSIVTITAVGHRRDIYRDL